MKQWLRKLRRREHRGQSLVEVALFLPILLFIMAGLVEVSNLLVTQNRVTTASRISAGFGATNFNEDNWADVDPVTLECLDGTACDMGRVAINTVTETLNLSPELWDVWSINARFDSTGAGFNFFTHTHSYGNFDVIGQLEWSQAITEVQNSMIADLKEGGANTQNLAVVATAAFHDINSILGIPIWQWTGLKTIQGLTVMRVDEKPAFLGCPILPIAIRLDQFSIYPTNWTELGGPNLASASYPFAPVDLFPAPGDWQYPDPPPTYDQLGSVTGATTSVSPNAFYRNIPGTRLSNAKPGHLYWARDLNSDPSGNFGWLSWQDESNSEALGTSLNWPGDFVDPDPDDNIPQGYKGSAMDMGTTADCPWADSGDGNGHLAIGEWAANAPGNMNANSVKSAMEFYVDTGTPAFLIIYEFTNQAVGGVPECTDNPGSNVHFKVHEFAKVRLVGYRYQSNEKWILFEFEGWGLECNIPASQ
jgi:hypothetical protein